MCGASVSVVLVVFSVIDGSDMTQYDDDVEMTREEQNGADDGALTQLEWELASQEGRVTG